MLLFSTTRWSWSVRAYSLSPRDMAGNITTNRLTTRYADCNSQGQCRKYYNKQADDQYADCKSQGHGKAYYNKQVDDQYTDCKSQGHGVEYCNKQADDQYADCKSQGHGRECYNKQSDDQYAGCKSQGNGRECYNKQADNQVSRLCKCMRFHILCGTICPLAHDMLTGTEGLYHDHSMQTSVVLMF